MKGVILADGSGTRLLPITREINKHLLPVYSKPMIFHPVEKLKEAGITDILIIVGHENAGGVLDLLGSGKEFGVKLTYKVQDEPRGIANALAAAEDFIENEKFIVLLGDNIFEENLKEAIEEFKNSEAQAKVFLKQVENPQQFGVAEINENRIINVEEKPQNPKSNLIVTGIYMYSPDIFDIIRNLKPSARGELEITDANNEYLRRGTMSFSILQGFWCDAGTFESLYKATEFLQSKQKE